MDAPPTASLDGFDEPAAPAVRPGATIGRYVVGELLGAGGMGLVYRGRDPALDRALAIKVVRPRGGGTEGRARLLREAQAMAKLRHPNVVPIFDVGSIGDDVYVVMPFLEGGTLGAWTKSAPRPWREVVARYIAAGRGLAAAHAAGLVHRDFKPDNVLIDADGDVAVADFGLARLEGTVGAAVVDGDLELTHTGDVLGTPAYMAPEQMRAEPSDARADQFSFCVALWEALYGKRPFDAEPMRGTAALAVLLAQISEGRRTPSTRDVPGWIRAALDRGLREDPAGRWPSMTALLGALARPRRGRAVVLAVAGSAIVAAGAVLAIATRGGGPTTPPPAVQLRLETNVGRGDVENAALSPDGTKLAVISGGRLLLRDPSGQGADTELADHVSFVSLGWSPDGTHLLVPRVDHDRMLLLRVDVASHAVDELRFGKPFGAFVTDDQVVIAHPTDHRLWWRTIGDGAGATSCALPDDVAEVRGLGGLDADTAVVAVTDAEGALRLLVYRRDCRLRATIAPPALSAFHVRYGHEIVSLSTSEDAFTLQGWSADGVALGPPRRGAGQVVAIAGRVGDRDALVLSTPQTIALRQHGAEPPTTIVRGEIARLAPSPDGERIAWIELTATSRGGVLRVDAADRIGLRAGAIADGVEHVAWSPDGRMLATISGGPGKPALRRLDAATGAETGISTGKFDRDFDPAWLDDHRVAALRLDHHAFAWVDFDAATIGTVTEPEAGRTFVLLRAPDGALLYDLDRGTGFEAWIDDGVRRSLGALASDEFLALGPGGMPLVFDSKTGEIWSLDRQTGARTERLHHPLAGDEELAAVAPLGDDLLLTIARLDGHVVLATPE